MTYKFEKLEVYQLALDYLDLTYALADSLPRSEEYNLRSQIIRAATSIVLNIAEGSTSQSDPEQSRFLGVSLRSFIETVTCRPFTSRSTSSTVQVVGKPRIARDSSISRMAQALLSRA